jgi:hypothetical protein
MRARQRTGAKQECCLLELNVNTFRGDIKLAALGDLDRLDGSVGTASLGVLDLLDDVVALEDLTEDDVLAIEPPADNCQYCDCNWFVGDGVALTR